MLDPKFEEIANLVAEDYPEVVREWWPEVQQEDVRLAQKNPRMPWEPRVRQAFETIRDRHFTDESHEHEAHRSAQAMAQVRNSHNELKYDPEMTDEEYIKLRQNHLTGRGGHQVSEQSHRAWIADQMEHPFGEPDE
jgi:hypothetical protein